MFAAKHLSPDMVRGKRVLDVGSSDYNGSMRPLIEYWGCAEYVGIDMEPGHGVDIVMNADDSLERFGSDSFDIVICLEMMEHTRHWRTSLHNIKGVCKPGGLVLMTSPAQGYPYHGLYSDFWRYQPEDFQVLFGDFEEIRTEFDAQGPGSCVAARKPESFLETDLSKYELFSICNGRRCADLVNSDYQTPYFRRILWKLRLKDWALRIQLGAGRLVTRLFGIR
ncbi:MAG: methyltransferase domain-containing protein [Verrucomicrobia bacterium]|nr:methyltransferase domain-containing protein [Verrucomicrobiota bacterium]